jgi:nicotinamide riboside kinase
MRSNPYHERCTVRYPDVSLQIVPQESPLLEEWLSAQRHDLGLTETLHTPAGDDSCRCATG